MKNVNECGLDSRYSVQCKIIHKSLFHDREGRV